MPTAISDDGLHIEFAHLGGEGPPLLLSHATGFCGSTWRPVAAGLADTFSCWALDARAHGRSDRPSDGVMTWDSISRDVLAVVDGMDALGVDVSELRGVGHSMGGAINVLAEVARPGTFAALWAFEPIIFPPTSLRRPAGPNPLAEGARRRRREFPSRTAARENFASKPPMSAFAGDALDGYLDGGLRDLPDGSVQLACDPEDEARCYEMGPRPGGFDELADLGIPLTVVVGGDTNPGPATFGPAIVDAVASATLERQSDLTHFGPMEDPPRIAGSIRAALAP